MMTPQRLTGMAYLDVVFLFTGPADVLAECIGAASLNYKDNITSTPKQEPEMSTAGAR